MAISLSSNMQGALDDYERYGVVLFTFDFGASTYGLWTGLGTIDNNSVTYVAGGSVLDVTNIEQSADGSVGELTIELSTTPDKAISSDILVALYDETWHLQPVTIELAMLNPDTGELIDTQVFFRGRVEEAPYEEDEKTAKITARCVSKSIELSSAGNLYRNSSTQSRFDSADTALDGIGTLNGSIEKEIKWGQA